MSPPGEPLLGGFDNDLLTALPPRALSRLEQHLELVRLNIKQVLYDPGEPITHAYFPGRGCIISMVRAMRRGGSAEVHMVGHEGVVGCSLCIHDNVSADRTIVQAAGDAIRVSARVFQDEADRSGPLRDLMQMQLCRLLRHTTQHAACNALHTLEQRLCRWLLAVHDRVTAAQFPLTHDFISQMLGVRRASVAVIAQKLQQAGLISYRWGKVTVLDRGGLENGACECYIALRDGQA